jgi:predicted metal-dependent phosphoesterase TrpH
MGQDLPKVDYMSAGAGTILMETHLHTKTGSSCGLVSPGEIPDLYKKAGYGAIVVTDHYYKKTINEYSKSADAWLEGYRKVRRAGKEAGIKVFLGMELRLDSIDVDDFLVYGLDEEFIKNNEKIYQLSLAEMFEFLDSNGFLIYQAHPFREENTVRDPGFMHGIEVFNGKQRQENNNERAEAHAKEHSLLQISGSDFHRYEDIGSGGIYIDKAVETEKELVQFLRTCDIKLKKS